jgi:anti-anti-sigma regulatory factor
MPCQAQCGKIRSECEAHVASKTTIEIEIHSLSACILTLHGDHDLASRPGTTLALAVSNGYLNVLMDLSDCSFADASIDDALLTASQRLRERDGSLELVVPTGAVAVRRVLEDGGVPSVLPFHETRGAGIASIDAATRLRAHPSAEDAGRASQARIAIMQAQTEDRRNGGQTAGHPGVIVLRAQLSPATGTAGD